MIQVGTWQFSSLQIWPCMIPECEDSVSPLWLRVRPASRMALKAVCLSLWSLLNTKKNLCHEPSLVPVCSQRKGSGSMLNRAGVICLYFMTKPILCHINSKLTAPVRWQNIALQMNQHTQAHHCFSLCLRGLLNGTGMPHCAHIFFFSFWLSLWDRPLINYIKQNLHLKGFFSSSGLMLLMIWLGMSV